MTVKVSNIMFDLYNNILYFPKPQYTHTNIYERYSSLSWPRHMHHTCGMPLHKESVLKSEY